MTSLCVSYLICRANTPLLYQAALWEGAKALTDTRFSSICSPTPFLFLSRDLDCCFLFCGVFCGGRIFCCFLFWSGDLPFAPLHAENSFWDSFHAGFSPNTFAIRNHPKKPTLWEVGGLSWDFRRDAWSSVNLLAECPSCALISLGAGFLSFSALWDPFPGSSLDSPQTVCPSARCYQSHSHRWNLLTIPRHTCHSLALSTRDANAGVWKPHPWITSLYWAEESERNRCFKGSVNPWRWETTHPALFNNAPRWWTSISETPK